MRQPNRRHVSIVVVKTRYLRNTRLLFSLIRRETASLSSGRVENKYPQNKVITLKKSSWKYYKNHGGCCKFIKQKSFLKSKSGRLRFNRNLKIITMINNRLHNLKDIFYFR